MCRLERRFVFQAEDGIRAGHVTGVQSCALPIWPPPLPLCGAARGGGLGRTAAGAARGGAAPGAERARLRRRLLVGGRQLRRGDRKSTRLNSSHVAISYAVFCLKKKNKIESDDTTIEVQHYHTR